MSKSMHHLRNSAKWLLPILGVILIITWLIVPAIQQAMESSRGPNPEGDAVVVTWTGGSVKRSQLNRMRQERYAAAQFVQLLIQRTQENKGEPRQAPISGNLSDGDVMDALLFASKAQEMGVIVDDNSVKDYLRAICDYPPAAEQESIWAEAASRVAKTQNVDASTLFERLKLELSALQGRQLLTTGTASVPLGGLWASHLRVQRQVRIEAYPFPVADYLERVSEKPTDAELRKIYEDGRSSVENPQSPTPGFMQPDRAVLQYARLDFEPFLEEAKRGFTEEQIAAEYEKMKTAGSFKIPELPVEVELPNPFEGLDPDALVPPAPVTPPQPSNPDGAAPGKPEPPRPPAEEGDAPAAPEPEAPKADAPKADAPKQSRLGPGGVVYVAAQADEKTDPAAKTPPVEVKPAAPATEKPAEVKPVEVKPVATPPAEAKPVGRPPRYRPLTEVREEVLDALASPKAAESRVEFLQKLYSAVDAYARKYTRWESLQTRDGKTDKATLDPTKNDGPGELPIAALLATRKLKLETTPLISPFEAEPFPIARVQGFFDAAFDPRVGLYMPSTIPWNVQSDAAGVRGSREPAYILWKSKFVEHKQLEFGEAKEKVIAAWKKEKAAKLAAADAKALAEKGASTPSLRDVAPDAKRVIAPPAFASVNLGALFGGAEFSPVPGVENAGDEFMEAVFGTQVCKTASAPDSRHNVYYAIRLIADDSNITDMRQRFAEQGMAFVTNQLAQMEAMRLNMKVLSESLKPYQVKWLTPPLGGDSSFD